MKIVLYRILGNDLEPRHKRGQTYNNAKFTIEHEPSFEACIKRWVVNRIYDAKMEQKIIRLLEKNGCSYIHIPFDAAAYGEFIKKAVQDMQIAEKLRSREERERYAKCLYIMNNNGARNAALRDGKKIADWILPFDGNCCFTLGGWKQVVDVLSVQTTLDRYFAVPMYRLTDNRRYFDFDPQGNIEHEPQIIFGRHTDCEFNEWLKYGDTDKMELLKRLDMPGKVNDMYSYIITDPAYRCGYIVRLFSGVKRGEDNWHERGRLREAAIDRMLKKVDGGMDRRQGEAGGGRGNGNDI